MESNKPVLLFDMDDVLALFAEGFWDEVALRFPAVKIPHISVSNSWDLCTVESGLTREMMLEIFESPYFFRNLKVAPHAVEVMKQLEEANANAFICSAPYITNPTCASDKVEWVGEHFGPWWQKRVILTMDKTMVYGDYLFDDKPVITGLRKPSWQHVVWDRNYNRDSKGLRILNWESAYDFISTLPVPKRNGFRVRIAKFRAFLSSLL